MAVASIRVSSVQLTASSGATSAFYSGGQQQRVATRGRKGVAVVGATMGGTKANGVAAT